MASFPINSSLLDMSPNPTGAPEIPESDVEDEVDQLDSDSEVGETANEALAKKNDPIDGQRVPGQSLLPAVRLENIITAEGTLLQVLVNWFLLKVCILIIILAGVTGSLALSKEGLFMLSIATVRLSLWIPGRCGPLTSIKEEFIKRMAEAGHLKATSERRTTVTYPDMGKFLNSCRKELTSYIRSPSRHDSTISGIHVLGRLSLVLLLRKEFGFDPAF